MSDDVKPGGFHCYDCSAPPPPYMVLNEVWRTAMPEYSRLKHALRHFEESPDRVEREKRYVLLCLTCLERRLGRPIEIGDFDLTVPINLGIALGYRLGREKT